MWMVREGGFLLSNFRLLSFRFALLGLGVGRG